MSSKSWMPMYWSDYLGDTRHLSTLQHGAYLLLIAHYWTNGGLPGDPKYLQNISGLSDFLWQKNLPVLRAFFDENWRHKRIDAELIKSDELRTKRQISGRVGGIRKHYKGYVTPIANATNFSSNCLANALPTTVSKIRDNSDSEKSPTQNGHTLDPGDFGSPTRSLATALPTGALARGSSSQTNSKLKPLAVSPQLEAIIHRKGWDDD